MASKSDVFAKNIRFAGGAISPIIVVYIFAKTSDFEAIFIYIYLNNYYNYKL